MIRLVCSEQNVVRYDGDGEESKVVKGLDPHFRAAAEQSFYPERS